MKNSIIEGWVESIIYCASQIKTNEDDTEAVEEYLDAIQRRVDHIRKELESEKVN